MAKYPLHRSVQHLYQKLARAVGKFQASEVSLRDALGMEHGSLDDRFHDIPAAFRELERQGKIRILEDGDRFRPTEEFGIPPQYVTGPIPAGLSELLHRHRQDAASQTGAYATLYVIENGVRDLIAQVLGRARDDWWELLPREARDEAERAFRDDRETRGAWGELSLRERLGYVTFDSLRKIVAAQWDLFKRIIDSQHAFGGELEKVEPIRHALAHTRPLPPAQIARLEVCADYVAKIAKVADKEMAK
jgi:hypothetical protein